VWTGAWAGGRATGLELGDPLLPPPAVHATGAKTLRRKPAAVDKDNRNVRAFNQAAAAIADQLESAHLIPVDRRVPTRVAAHRDQSIVDTDTCASGVHQPGGEAAGDHTADHATRNRYMRIKSCSSSQEDQKAVETEHHPPDGSGTKETLRLVLHGLEYEYRNVAKQ